jgi:hypothetical protein
VFLQHHHHQQQQPRPPPPPPSTTSTTSVQINNNNNKIKIDTQLSSSTSSPLRPSTTTDNNTAIGSVLDKWDDFDIQYFVYYDFVSFMNEIALVKWKSQLRNNNNNNNNNNKSAETNKNDKNTNSQQNNNNVLGNFIFSISKTFSLLLSDFAFTKKYTKFLYYFCNPMNVSEKYNMILFFL